MFALYKRLDERQTLHERCIDEEWAFVTPNLVLVREDAPQHGTTCVNFSTVYANDQVGRGLATGCITGEAVEEAGAMHGIQLEAIKQTEAKKGFVLLPRRWGGERSFA